MGHQSVMGLGVDGGGDVEVRVEDRSLGEDRERVGEEMRWGSGWGKGEGGYDLLCSFVTHEYVAMLTVEN